jgi:predicted methyltransferase
MNLRILATAILLTMASPITAALAQKGDGPTFLSSPGLPANAFPKPSRPVAEIISPIFDTETNRDAAKETEQVFALMKLKSGMSVADIGAGSGYYTVRLAKLLGADGRVFAQDVMPNYLRDLNARIFKAKLPTVTVSRGEPHDPRLPANSIDAAVLVHMYHEIAQPFAFLHNLAVAMKPGGIIGILDADRQTWQHGTPPALLRCELAAVGYREVSFTTLTGGLGYLAIFEAPEAQMRKQPDEVKSCPLEKPR